jgi:hypothetical protein
MSAGPVFAAPSQSELVEIRVGGFENPCTGEWIRRFHGTGWIYFDSSTGKLMYHSRGTATGRWGTTYSWVRVISKRGYYLYLDDTRVNVEVSNARWRASGGDAFTMHFESHTIVGSDGQIITKRVEEHVSCGSS